ncbi:TonB-dependent receptor [Bdellovibrio sp. ArHS]|uniref:TonB-dependent receptor n=1 Tax=Bdellovibrio sp. ArHS TaxID=1569284 RepID=UPI0025B922BC|nr:TonB-dependent receptor [Bdellovibrio sp. ArHS]
MMNKSKVCGLSLYVLMAVYSGVVFAEGSADTLPTVTIQDSNKTGHLERRTRTQGDSLKALDEEPSVQMQTGGGISSLPVMHGVSSDRVNVKVDGVGVTASCPNHMNPALSYISSFQVEAITAIPGITPVSLGGDSLGGSILVNTQHPGFTSGESRYSGQFSSIYGSNEDYLNLSAHVGFADLSNSVGYYGTDEKARDYKNGKSDIVKRTAYEQNNHSLVYARKLADGTLSFRVGRTAVPKQGFVNQYMDMLENTAMKYNVKYRGLLGTLKSDVSLSHQNVDHYMDKLRDYSSGQMPMYTDSKETNLLAKSHLISSQTSDTSAGVEVNFYSLNDWWTPVSGMGGMSPNNFVNINDGHRDRYAFFVENETQWNSSYSTNIGARVDVVSMDTGRVQGYNNTSNAPADEAYFNSLERNKTDVNYDMTWLNAYQISESQKIVLGLGRKSRSPNLYERYTWAGLQSTLATSNPVRMDMRMINWFGDGNGYVGNINLRPEVSHILSASYFYQSAQGAHIEITPYYSEIQDYIDADLKYISTTGSDTGVRYLQFANHDAIIFGTEASVSWDFLQTESYGAFNIKALTSFTRGYRKDGVSDLYNQMPWNGKLILNQETSKWKNRAEVHMVAAKEDVSGIRNEHKTGAYATADLGTEYKWGTAFTTSLQVLNVFDTQYDLPLGGKDILNGKSPVAGKGRSFVVGLNYDL